MDKLIKLCWSLDNSYCVKKKQIKNPEMVGSMSIFGNLPLKFISIILLNLRVVDLS